MNDAAALPLSPLRDTARPAPVQASHPHTSRRAGRKLLAALVMVNLALSLSLEA